MPTFTPVDHDPFADDAPAPSAPSSAPSISFSDAPSGGGGPAAPSSSVGPVFVPVDGDPFADDAGARPLTICGGRSASRPTMDTPIGGSAPVLPAGLAPPRSPVVSAAPAGAGVPPASATSAAADVPPGSLSYDEAFPSPTPHPGGTLSNSQDDGYLSGAAKGTATGLIKGLGDAVGAYGGLSNLVDYMISRGESAITGKPLDEVMAAADARRKAVKADMAQDPLGRLALASDPGNVLPAPNDVSGPILAKTGEYVPTSAPGRIAQAAVEAVPAMLGPGGGMISPGTAGKAVVGALARQAPGMAVAGGVGQEVSDVTGDPLLGLGAGLAGAPLTEVVGSKAAGALAPVVGGSKLLNAAPVIGPAIARARGNEVARTILGTADDPVAVRAAASAPAPDPAVPGSPQTFASQIGDQGLYEAEKALRNTRAEKLTDGSAPTYFNAVDRGQSAAQTAALRGVQPTGDVFAPGQAISARMDAINAAADEAIDRLTAAHADAVASRAASGQAFADGLRSDLAARQADRTQAGLDFAADQRAGLADRTIARGQASGEAKSDAAAARQADHDALVQRLGDAYSAQQGAAADAAAPLADGQVGADGLGASLRSSIEAVRAGQKDIHRQLYQAVDPTNSLAMVATPIADRASSIATDLASKGGEMAPTEAALFRRAAGLRDVESYGVAHQLDTDLSAAISTERRASGESPTWARLSQLKSAVKGAMNDAADNHSAWEQRQVAAGVMAPEDTIAARLRGAVDDLYSAEQPQARRATGTDPGPGPAPRSADAAGQVGTAFSEGGGLGGAPRDQGLSPDRGTDPAQAPGGVDPLPNAPVSSALRRTDPLTDGIRARTTDAEAALKQVFGEERGGKLAANPLQAIRWLSEPEAADNLFTLPRQREAIRAYGEAARQAREAYFAERQEAMRQRLEEIDRNPSPLDRRLVPGEGDDLRTGANDGEIREGPDGQHYLLTHVENNPFTGTQTTRWAPLGEHASLHDLVATHTAIAGARETTPLGASARALNDIFDRAGVGNVPTYTMPEDAFLKATGGRDAGGFFFPEQNRILIKEGGSPQRMLHVAVHEGLHAAFYHALHKDPEVAAGVDAMLAHAKAWRRQVPEEAGEFSNTYGLTNRDEYVSEAFSNPQFQKFLSQVPVTSELLRKLNLAGPAGAMRSLWDAFLSSIHKAFGIGFDPKSMSLLEATVRYGDRISSAAERTPRTMDGLLSRAEGAPTALPSRGASDDPRFDAPGFDPDGTPRAPTRPEMPRPQDLRAFVRSRGGMIDTGGDLAAMGMPELIGKGARALDPDKMREAAAEAGYLGADTVRAMRETHSNDLLDALAGDRPVHAVRDEDAAAAWQAYDEARERYDAALGEFGTRSRFGVVPERAPDSSYSRDDIEGPNGPQMREPTPSGLRPNFGGEAAGRLRAANAAYAQYARTYKNPIVGPGLRTTGHAGQYASTDAAFIKAAIQPGADGYERARAFLTAAKDDPDALAAMHDAVLNPLRKAVTGNGTLPPRELEKWKSADGYGPALRALDEVTPGFSSRFDDAGRASQTLLDLGQAHKAEIAAANAEAARRAILDNVARRAKLGQETADDRAMVARMVADRRASDQAAGRADRQSTASAIADRAASDRAADARSRADMRSGKVAVSDVRNAANATAAARFARVAGGAVAPEEVENAVGGMLKTGTSGAARMRSLVQSIQPDPGAPVTPELAGLRKAAVDYIVREHTGADGNLLPGKLILFLRDNAATLNELFPHDQRTMFGALARDAEAGIRWRTSTAIKGGSDSAKNLLAALDKAGKGGPHPSIGFVAAEALGYGLEKLESVGWKAAGLAAAGAGVAYLGNSLRSAGIRNTANLYREAMANPELARALIQKMPATTDGNALHYVARVLRRATIVGPMLAGPPPQDGARQAAGAR